MPAVRFVLVQPDSITVAKNNGITFVVNRSQISTSTLNGPISGVETAANSLFVTQMGTDGIMEVHITQVNPQILWNAICLNAGLPVPPNWWAKG